MLNNFPPGSILDPIFFLTYTNDAVMLKFVDNTKLFELLNFSSNKLKLQEAQNELKIVQTCGY